VACTSNRKIHSLSPPALPAAKLDLAGQQVAGCESTTPQTKSIDGMKWIVLPTYKPIAAYRKSVCRRLSPPETPESTATTCRHRLVAQYPPENPMMEPTPA